MSTAELLDCFIGLQLTFTITERNSSMPAAGLVKYGPDLVLRQQWRRPGDGTAWWVAKGSLPIGIKWHSHYPGAAFRTEHINNLRL